ncbi:hypothetical protein F2Q70_00012180 [Brassica cretica]|uniref:Uncharacterized protein n=1 Tax=Brassica cretica TaxID=69181 RepID=A0A8S9M850_BRACR|nr:hypothetical protein F2Q70_00012180 [Brassica cretica]
MTSMRLRLAGCSSSAEESPSSLLFRASSSLGRANGVDWFVERVELPYPLVPSFSADYEN